MNASLSWNKYQGRDIKDISLQELLFLSIKLELLRASQELEALSEKLFQK